MSNAPGILLNYRKKNKFGNTTIHDHLLIDGLQDAFSGKLMGNCAEKTAKDYNITREM